MKCKPTVSYKGLFNRTCAVGTRGLLKTEKVKNLIVGRTLNCFGHGSDRSRFIVSAAKQVCS